MDYQKLYQQSIQSLLALSHEEGIHASAAEETFGCVFGRDTALTVLKILKAHHRQNLPELLEISRRSLLTLVGLQGKAFNPESGEEPGKFIHEFRRSQYEHLLQSSKPWFVYPDGFLRNYDSIDSTPLTLIALYQYWKTTNDDSFLISVLPAVEAGLNWLITYGDKDKDFLIEYSLPERSHGGLTVQSWMDSYQSILKADGQMPNYPLAPVEVQGFAWLALKLWTRFYSQNSPDFARKINSFAAKMKERFNQMFILQDQGLFFAAQALDGDKYQIKTITANPLLLLWAAFKEVGEVETILDPMFITSFVERGFKEDMFVLDAGIRTMSSLSPTFNPNPDSYHNGSFWPILNGLVSEGLENFGFYGHAQRLKQASLSPILHFGTPIELYIKAETGYLEYLSPSGQHSCHLQAWSAASILEMTINLLSLSENP